MTGLRPLPDGGSVTLIEAGRRRDGTTFPAGISLSAVDIDEAPLEDARKLSSGQDDASTGFDAIPAGDGCPGCYVRDNGAGFDAAFSGQLSQPFGGCTPRNFPAPALAWPASGRS